MTLDTTLRPPRYEHTCSCCAYLGHEGEYDLYFCAQGGRLPTIVARYGDGASHYASGLNFHQHKPISEGKTRAIQMLWRELLEYRTGYVTEEMLRQHDGTLKLGRGCSIVVTEDYEALLQRVAFLKGELRWIRTRDDVPALGCEVEVNLSNKLVKARRVDSPVSAPPWEYFIENDSPGGGFWCSMSTPAKWRTLEDL